MTTLLFYIIYPIIWIITLLPLRILYLFSDINYFILKYIFRYRRKIILRNFNHSFPNKSKKEVSKFLSQYYRYISDLFIESLKVIHLSKKQMKKRFVITNPEVLEIINQSGKGSIAIVGHYGNWDWCTSASMWNTNLVYSTLYKKIRNQSMDTLFLNLRQKYGMRMFDKNKVLRAVIELEKETHPYIMTFNADQCPKASDTKIWVKLLNQETAFFSGWERIARKMNLPIYYIDIKRPKRGYYTATLKLMCESPKEKDSEALIQMFANELEKTIKYNPVFWLWSHKRWKYKREDL